MNYGFFLLIAPFFVLIPQTGLEGSFALETMDMTFSAPTFTVPIGIELILQNGSPVGIILQPGQTVRIDTLMDKVIKIRFTENCGTTARIFETSLQIPLGTYNVTFIGNGKFGINTPGNPIISASKIF